MGVIMFNNQSSHDLGIKIERFPNYETPEKDYDVIHVPGRNGDVIIDKGTFLNVPRRYQISVATTGNDFYKVINPIAEWLHSSSGYARLEDSYEPDYYRLAVYRESNSIENIFDDAGRATISFDCKPQRFLKSGDIPVAFYENGSLRNPTNFSSFPIISLKISKNEAGFVRVGNYQFSIKAQTSEIDYLQDSSSEFILDSSQNKISAVNILELTVNSELQDAYSGTINLNSMIVLNGGDFPKLEPGDNSISFSGGITMLEVIPKWWTI